MAAPGHSACRVNAIEFRVRRLRLEGRTIPNWERGSYEVQGALQVEEAHSEEMRRHVRLASVSGRARDGTPVRLMLYDPTLVCARSDAWTMTGFERFEQAHGVTLCYLQSWLMLPVTDVMLREDEWVREQEELSRQFSAALANFVGPPAPRPRSRRRR